MAGRHGEEEPTTVTLREAVATALSSHGTDLLSSPQQFVGTISDLVDTESSEMIVLYRCCDERLLEPFEQACAAQDASRLERAATLAQARLTGDYAIDANAARSVAGQIGLGLCDHLGVSATQGLVQMTRRVTPASAPLPGRGTQAGTPGSQRLQAISGPPPESRRQSGQQTLRRPAASAPQGARPVARPMQAPPQAAQPAQRNTGALAAAIIGIALALVAIMFVVVVPSLQSDGRYQVVASVDAPGLDAEGSRIPVHVSGATSDGGALDEQSYIDYAGEGLELPPGNYDVTLECSPVAKDGTVYAYEGITLTISIPTGDPAGTIYEVGSNATISLAVKPIDQVDQTLLNSIMQYLGNDPGLDAEQAHSLSDALQQAYDAYWG